jgi:enterobactin synthetase component F
MLVAHLESAGSPIDMSAVAEALEQLPPKLRPARFQIWDRLPRTIHGKLDRAALIGLSPSTSPSATSSAADDAADAIAGSVSPAGRAVQPGVAATEPTSAMVATVLDAMRVALERDLSADDDFFRTGGDSLAALVTVTRIEQAIGRPVMVTRLIEHPTARSLAAALDAAAPHAAAPHAAGMAGDPLRHPLVEWEHGDPTDRSLPLLAMFAHGGNGHLLGYYDLLDGLRTLGLPNQVVGFRLPGADERTSPRATVEEQVDAFFDAFLAIAGDRPCVLLGGSSGGLLAWEVARRRRALGHTDDTVLFMDTVHPDALRESRGSRLDKYRQLFTDGGAAGVAREVRVRLESRRRLFLATRRGERESAGTVLGAAQTAAVLVEESVDRSAMAYHPVPQPGRTVLLAAATTDRAYTEQRWRPIAGGLVVVPVEGSHNGPDSIGAAHRVHQVADAAVAELQLLNRP